MSATIDTTIFRPKMTKTSAGWSTGWTESQRSTFTPMALCVVLNGLSVRPISLAEAAEAVYHFWGRGRESVQSSLMETGNIKKEALPDLMQYMNPMRVVYERRSPAIAQFFHELRATPEYKMIVAQCDDMSNVTASAADAFTDLVFKRFGRNIQIEVNTRDKVVDPSKLTSNELLSTVQSFEAKAAKDAKAKAKATPHTTVAATVAVKENKCFSCGSPSGPLRCSRCKLAYYCGQECQVSHWKTHKNACVAPAKPPTGTTNSVPSAAAMSNLSPVDN